MNENAPSFEEIMTAWEMKCPGLSCKECKLSDPNSRYSCRDRYVHAVLTGKMKLEDSFRKDEPKPEPAVPAWCKIGQWVTYELPDEKEVTVVLKITRFFDGERDVVAVYDHGGRVTFTTGIETLKPVRFREYTFEEAKTLLGKVMEYNEDGILPAAAIIGMVSRDSSKVYYNGAPFEELQNWNATIDGIPVGVPEIDEEALEGGQE